MLIVAPIIRGFFVFVHCVVMLNLVSYLVLQLFTAEEREREREKEIERESWLLNYNCRLVVK